MVTQLSPQEAKTLIDRGDVIVADVRDYASYMQQKIEGAIHLSLPGLQQFCDTTDKNTPILIYCYHGISSQAVVQYLLEQGFVEVFSLAGGFEIWKEHYPLA